MGKRPPLVILSSSSDDDGGGARRTAASRAPPARRTRTPATAPPPKQEPSSSRKKPRRGGSGGRGRRRASDSAPSGSLKVEDVKKWLEEKLEAPKGTFGGLSLVLTGQAGVGKSATVKAIAAELGADLCEWTTPVPTLWAEHVHANSALDFIDDDAIDDAWVVLSYLSDADCLLAGSPITSARIVNESDSMSQLIAASVAARGVLFGNAHASPSRWHTIRSPKVWQIERTFRSTKDQIFTERFDCSSTSGSRNFSDIVTDFRPFERWIGPHGGDMPRNNSSHHYFEGRPNLIGKLDGEGNNSEEEEDAIEDC
ncbi:hypothetical protein ACQ4PT_056302 [Festuca glaucescens]